MTDVSNEEDIDLDLLSIFDYPSINESFNENSDESIICVTPSTATATAAAAVKIDVTPTNQVLPSEDADDDKENNERAIHYAIQNFTRISATNHSSSVSVAGFPLRDKFARVEKVDWSKLEHLSGTKRIRTQRINDSTN